MLKKKKTKQTNKIVSNHSSLFKVIFRDIKGGGLSPPPPQFAPMIHTDIN